MTQSLAAQRGGLAQAAKIPSVFQKPVTEAAESRRIAPYVTFCHHNRADEWKRLSNEHGQPEEGDMYLVTSDSTFRLEQMRLCMLQFMQFWARINPGTGDLLETSFSERPKPWGEQVEVAGILLLDDAAMPVNVTFKTTKCPAAVEMSKALVLASAPEWADLSPAHKETAICNFPWERFFGEVEIGATRTSKATGMPYRPAQCRIVPTSIPEWRLLHALYESEGWEASINACAARFEFRQKEVLSKAAK